MSSASSRPEPPAARHAAAWRLLTDPPAAAGLPAAAVAGFAARLSELLGPAQAAGALRPALGEALPLPPGPVLQSRLLARRARHHQLAALRCLQEAGLPFLVLKGFALAHRPGADPLERIGDDVDVLLPAAEIERAALQLTASGWRFAGPPPPAWGRTARVSLPPLAAPDRSTAIDLHREADEWPFARALPAARCLALGEPFEAGGLALATLPPTESLLLAVSHAAKDKFGPFALRKLLDALLLLRAGGVDPDRLAALAAAAGLRRPLATAGALLRGLGHRGDELPAAGGIDPLLRLWEGLFEPAPGRWRGLWHEARYGPGWRHALARNARRLGGLLARRPGGEGSGARRA